MKYSSVIRYLKNSLISCGDSLRFLRGLGDSLVGIPFAFYGDSLVVGIPFPSLVVGIPLLWGFPCCGDSLPFDKLWGFPSLFTSCGDSLRFFAFIRYLKNSLISCGDSIPFPIFFISVVQYSFVSAAVDESGLEK